MILALQNNVEIELLIENGRDELFKKIALQAPYIPPGYVPNRLASTSQVFLGRRALADYDDKLPTYCIQDSYLSSDGSKRIFKVQYDTFEHYYYAFEFKGYVVCPAFFVSMFNVTDYACLDVSNGSHYYYIFLSRMDDDPLPIILGESNFHGKCKLKLPSDEHKLLPLNSRTINLKCFISPNRRNKDLCKECGEFSSSDQLMKLEFAPSYWFVPVELKKLFAAKYPLVDSMFLLNTILVHEDSKSFAEFLEFTKPITENLEDANLSIASLSSIFTATKYKREDYILNAFTEHLRRNFKVSSKGKVKDYFCSMIAVLQSSGYGKSRLMDRLGSKIPTFYSSLQLGAGYPEKSFFLARLIEELNRIVLNCSPYCHMNNVATAVYIFILRMLFVILKNPDINSLKNTFQIDSEIEGHKFFSKTASDDMLAKMEEIFKILFNGLADICKYNSSVIFNGTATLKLKDISIIQRFSPNKFAIGIYSEEALTCNLERDVMDILERIGGKRHTVHICN